MLAVPLRARGDVLGVVYLDDRLKTGAFGPRELASCAVGALCRHAWPGNVRELRNAIERACLLSRNGNINIEDALLGGEAAPALGIRTDLPFKEAKGQLVEMFEREYIEDLMRRHKMNLSAAAREAQIDRKLLRELLRKYGLDTRVELSDGH